jgi:hypothetical protein
LFVPNRKTQTGLEGGDQFSFLRREGLVLSRISFVISEEERQALEALAEREVRGLKEQARVLVRDGLSKAGVLPSPELSQPEQPAEEREP